MLRNPNHPPSAVFAPRPDGSFTRFNALTGAPMPATPPTRTGCMTATESCISARCRRTRRSTPRRRFSTVARQTRGRRRAIKAQVMLHPHQELQAARDLHDFAKDRLFARRSPPVRRSASRHCHHLAGGAAGEGEDQPLGGGMEISETHENPHQRPHSMTTELGASPARDERPSPRTGLRSRRLDAIRMACRARCAQSCRSTTSVWRSTPASALAADRSPRKATLPCATPLQAHIGLGERIRRASA